MKRMSRISRTALAIALSAAWQQAAFAQAGSTAQDSASGAFEQDQSAAQSGQVADDVIVTGTRATGVTAAESAAPIKVLDAEVLSHVGQPNLNQVLTQLVPSFTAQAFGGDTANLTLSARLRGLSPNHTLVLVNGKRRHGTANLAVLGGPYQGAATADLDLITPASIKRIEVLEDGAAAQYGSDAIAGVINIILKDGNSGGEISATAGEHYQVGGQTYAASLNLGTRIGEDGFINITAFHRFHDFTQVGGLDCRVTNPSGQVLTPGVPRCGGGTLFPGAAALYPGIANFPFVNRISGDAQSSLTNLQYNSAFDFGGVEAYSFGTYSRRLASAYENLRIPDRVIRSPVLGVAGNFATPGEIVFSSTGFSPREKIREDDMAFTGGVRGDAGGFHYDLSTTFGQDKNLIYTVGSANASLFVDTGFTPTDFYDGFFKSTEFTVNADLRREFQVGMVEPLSVAFGGEYRRNIYEIGSGDAGSIYKEGGQSYPGFRPSDAGVNDRTAKSLYIDIAAMPIAGLKVDGAVRYEHYSDFGSKVIYKVTSRYDFSPAFALRGTVATGFRAPTLAESFYSATNVSPTAAFVQLPANSAAAKILGFDNLAPEQSTNYSLGTVIRPMDRLTITLDAYQVRIRDRILGTGSIFSAGGARNFALVRSAVIANGNVLDPTVTQTGVSLFANGATTRTRGVDLVVSYVSDFGDMGSVNWTISGNYNKTEATEVGVGPTLTDTAGVTAPIPLFNTTTISNLETASPRVKVVTSAFYTRGKFAATVRGTVYGVSSNFTSPNGGTFYEQKIGTAFIGDLELNYDLAEGLELAIGANNIFNKRPPTVALAPGRADFLNVGGGTQIDAPLTFSPYGINGGYYYARLNLTF